MRSVKQSKEEVLIQGAVKATIQILRDKRIFDNYDNADEILEEYVFSEVKEKIRPSSDQKGCKAPVGPVAGSIFAIFQRFC